MAVSNLESRLASLQAVPLPEFVNMAEKERKPNVLLIPCFLNRERDDLVKGITNCDCKDLVSNSCAINDSIQCTEYVWKIDNKYYTADLCLLLVQDPKPPSSLKEFTNQVEAVIISFELNDDISFAWALEWGRLFNETDIEVKVMMSIETVKLEGKEAETERADKWCLKNSFEFVDSFECDGGDFPDKIGFDRVKEILDTHLWPNMIMKSKESATGNDKSEEKKDKHIGGNKDQTDEAILNGNEAQLESFEALFGQMQEMKLHAQSLPDEERKEYAEKVTLAFWRAMGYDEDEIAGL